MLQLRLWTLRIKKYWNLNKLEVDKIFRRKIMIKIIIVAFLILGFVSAAVASARWKEKDEDE